MNPSSQETPFVMKKLFAAALFAATALAAQAQAWPDKPVTMIVPFPPGGSTDMLARALAPKLQEKLGQTFLVDNKPGATGTIGAALVKRAPPDGSTLLVSSLAPFVVAPHLMKALPYDALKDLDPLTVAVQAPNVLVVPAGPAAKTPPPPDPPPEKNPPNLAPAPRGPPPPAPPPARRLSQHNTPTSPHHPP